MQGCKINDTPPVVAQRDPLLGTGYYCYPSVSGKGCKGCKGCIINDAPPAILVFLGRDAKGAKGA